MKIGPAKLFSAPLSAPSSLNLGGAIPWTALGVSALMTLAILLLGTLLFNKVEKTFMDTV